MQEEQYLAFIDIIGKTVEGNFIYEFDFTQNPDVVWGDNWNVPACSTIHPLIPSKETLSLKGKVISPIEYNLARQNSCFSMQDCIDGIIALLFSDPRDKNEIVLHFGETIENVSEKLKKIGLELVDLESVTQEQEDEIVNATLNALEDNNDLDDVF